MALPAHCDPPVADLARFDEEWKRTAVSSDDSYPDVPDGIYDAIIEDARVAETVSSGRPVVIWRLRIRGPQAVDRVVTKNRVITGNTLSYLKEDLDKCRLTVSRLSELPDRLKELENRSMAIEKRTKDGRVNIFFRWESGRTGHEVPRDDVPF